MNKHEQLCKLAGKECIPCKGGISPMDADMVSERIGELGGSWNSVGIHHIERVYSFPDFQTALDFTNNVGRLAEEAGHHPDISLSWGRVAIQLWTHKIGGLAEADFVLAARIEKKYLLREEG